jgi:hypothetical protein
MAFKAIARWRMAKKLKEDERSKAEEPEVDFIAADLVSKFYANDLVKLQNIKAKVSLLLSDVIARGFVGSLSEGIKELLAEIEALESDFKGRL